MLDLNPFLTELTQFMQTMYVLKGHLPIEPKREHVLTCIDYLDLKEMRTKFVRELVNTIIPFVYSEDKQKTILAQLMKGRAMAAAWSELRNRARGKFKRTNLQGQFSEILLSNLLQYHFKAAPLLRKYPITTNPQVERNGADAIHIGCDSKGYLIFIGEAKTYDREKKSLQEALKDAITDLVQKHIHRHEEELNLYVHEEFLPEPLEDIARDYVDGKLKNVRIEGVCIATYDSDCAIKGLNREEKLACIVACITAALADPSVAKAISNVPEDLRPRLNYIVFPVQSLRTLIAAFEEELGV